MLALCLSWHLARRASWGFSLRFFSPRSAGTLLRCGPRAVAPPGHPPSIHLVFSLYNGGFGERLAPRFPLTHNLCAPGQPGVLFPVFLLPIPFVGSLIFPAFPGPGYLHCTKVNRTPRPATARFSVTAPLPNRPFHPSGGGPGCAFFSGTG